MPNHPIIAREGRAHLIIAVLCGVIATLLVGAWSAPVWLAALFVAQFFRDPRRRISDAPGVVVSPASGKIVAIGECDNPYLPGVKSVKLSIFMNVFSVHSNLIPIGGRVVKCWYHAGAFFNAALDKASAQNERNAIHIRTDDGFDVVCVQIAGLIARRILSYVNDGDAVRTGQRYGFIRFGSRVDVYLPMQARTSVRLGQWVTSGNDIIGHCGHDNRHDD